LRIVNCCNPSRSANAMAVASIRSRVRGARTFLLTGLDLNPSTNVRCTSVETYSVRFRFESRPEAMRMMRAAVQDTYGLETIRVEQRPIPVPPPGKLLVRVQAATINPADWHFAMGLPIFVRLIAGLRRPKSDLLGGDACGIVEALGDEVEGVAVGDRVFGLMKGGFGDYAIARADRVAVAPSDMSAEDAAGLPIAGVTALQAMELGQVQGKRVVVNGASGGVGHYAIQIAKAAGAAHVAGVCSGRNQQFVSDLGADHVFDYEHDDFTAETWDVLIDCIGNRSSSEVRGCLVEDGSWVTVGGGHKDAKLGGLHRAAATWLRWKFDSRSCHNFVAKETKERLDHLAALAAAGSLRTEISERCDLADIRSAFDRVESQRIRGKLAIVI